MSKLCKLKERRKGRASNALSAWSKPIVASCWSFWFVVVQTVWWRRIVMEQNICPFMILSIRINTFVGIIPIKSVNIAQCRPFPLTRWRSTVQIILPIPVDYVQLVLPNPVLLVVRYTLFLPFVFCIPFLCIPMHSFASHLNSFSTPLPLLSPHT